MKPQRTYEVVTRDGSAWIEGSEVVARGYGLIALLFPDWVTKRAPVREVTAHLQEGRLVLHRVGRSWLTLEGVENELVALDFIEEVGELRRRARG